MSMTTTVTPPAVTAAAASDDGVEPAQEYVDGLPRYWHAVVMVENVMGGDKRMFTNIGCRPLPLSLMFLPNTPDWGHTGAAMAGQILFCERREDGVIYAWGTWDLGGDAGREASRAGAEQLVRFVSVDLVGGDVEYVVTDWDFDDWGDVVPADGYLLISDANIGAVTQCTTPCIMQAVIAPIDVELDMSDIPAAQTGPLSLVASAIPTVPPEEWFGNPVDLHPEFCSNDGVDTMCNVSDDGEIWGRMCLWGDNHIGYPDPLTPPRDMDPKFPHFQFGRLKVATADGNSKELRTGRITMGIGHADLSLRHRAAAEHYDNVNACCADVRAGVDQYGIWYHGALRPGVTEEQIRVLRCSGVSVDIRGVEGRSELIACLVVNVPGFSPRAIAASAQPAPVTSTKAHFGENGEILALVAAGMKMRGPSARAHEVDALRHRLAALEADVRPIIAQQAVAARGRLRTPA